MGRHVVRNLLTFALVLVLTLGTVSLLSRVTSANAQSAPERYSQEVRSAKSSGVTEITAQVREEGVSPLVGTAAFLGVLAVTGSVTAAVIRSQRKQDRE